MNDFIKTPQLNNKPSIGYLAFITAFLCLGLGLVIGISIYSATISAKLKNFIITTGTVIDYKVTTSWTNSDHGAGPSQEAYAEIAEFEINGTIYTATNSISSTSGVKNIGDTVQIAYNPENPNDCIFITPNNKLALIIAFSIGIVFFIAAGCMLFGYCVRYKEWKKQKPL